jgi:hypothetical protein
MAFDESAIVKRRQPFTCWRSLEDPENEDKKERQTGANNKRQPRCARSSPRPGPAQKLKKGQNAKSGLKARQVLEKSRFAEDKCLDFLPVFLDFLPQSLGFPSRKTLISFRGFGNPSSRWHGQRAWGRRSHAFAGRREPMRLVVGAWMAHIAS